MSDPDILSILNSLLHEGGVESYIAFFRKRIEIEEDYQASLSKLASRQHDLERRLYGDIFQQLNSSRHHDPGASSDGLGGGAGSGMGAGSAGSAGPGSHHSFYGGPESVRQAWREITTSISHEASLRREWVKHLRENVVDPLEKFRASKERTLSRIRDDLRSSFTDHKEYAMTVGRLKKQYERKCDEVHQVHLMQEASEYRERVIEETQRAVSAVGYPISASTSRAGPSGAGGEEWEHVPSNGSPTHSDGSPPNAVAAGRPSADSHQTLLPSSPPAAGSSRHGREHHFPIISGATSVALKDTATPSPANPLQARGTDVLHALRSNTTNLIQRLNARTKDGKATGIGTGLGAGGVSSGGLGGGETGENTIKPSALRSVKLRREAEEADREYRKAVFHLDTLRLRKEQVIRGARRTAEEMLFESASEAKEAFGFFIDETRIASMKRVSICDHAQYLVNKISPEDDAARFSASLPRDYSEPKVLYENAFLGPCRSLLFGVALTDYVASNAPGRKDREGGPAGHLVPLIVQRCIDEIDRRGARLEGIYRISGKMQSVTILVHEIEKDEDAFRFDETKHDAYTISGVLKLYLRQLPTPLFSFPLQDRIAFSNNLEEQAADGYSSLVKKIRRLPPAHQATLKLLCAHLARVAAHSEENKMTASNLGLVFAPAVFSEEAGITLPAHAWKDSVMEVLIEHHEDLFEGLPLAEPSTPSRGGRPSFGPRPVSPAARKSLEADRFESYSRSVSPSRGYGLGLGDPPTIPERSEHMERQRSAKSPLGSIGPGGSQSPSPLPSPQAGIYRPLVAPTTSPEPSTTPVKSPPRRAFSLRKKSTGASDAPAIAPRAERPETILIPGPQYDAGPSLPPGAAPPTPPGDPSLATPKTSLTGRDRAASDVVGGLSRSSSEQLLAAVGPDGRSLSKSKLSGISSVAGQEQKRAASG